MKKTLSNFSVRPVVSALMAVIVSVGFFAGCIKMQTKAQQNSLFIGIDVSGSFYNSELYDNAVKFAAFYIYSHLNGLGNLKQPKALFVGSLGGESADEPKSFHPIHDFRDKSIEQIEADLRTWFTKSNKLTDFNVFFDKTALTIKKNNLTLAPVEVVLLTDGIPDVENMEVKNEKQRYASLKLKPLEYLARSITVRLLYPTAIVGNYWEKYVDRRRIKLWVAERDIMLGWQNQLVEGYAPEEQEKLLVWIKDNIDFFVRVKRFS